MFSQFFVQIFALYKFFRKNLRKKRRKFSMDPIWESVLNLDEMKKVLGKTGRFCTRTDLTLVHQTDLQIRSSYLPPLPHL